MLYYFETSRVCCHSKGSCLGGGTRGQYQILSYVLKTSYWMNIILEMLVQCDTNIDLNLCIYVSDLYFMVE